MDPFAPSNPNLLYQALTTLKVIFQQSWPVVSEERHRLVILKAFIVTWLNVKEELQNGAATDRRVLQTTKEKLETAARGFVRSVKEAKPLSQGEVEQLVAVQPELAELFNCSPKKPE